MKVNSFAKIAAGIGTFAVLAAGLVVTSPAQADPAAGPSNTALVGVGSDTTQDVMDAVAAAINTAAGSQKLASYTSTIPLGGSSSIQTRVGGPSNVLRAKGSGDGWKILQVAEGSVSSLSTVSTFDLSNQTANKDNSLGQIDFARASSLQGTADSSKGEYVDIPFAIDAVGVAVNPTDAVSKIPLTLGAADLSDSATTPSLRAIYGCKARYVYTDGSGNYVGVGADATLPAGATTASEITPLLPSFGSGTAAYFIKQLFNITDTAAWPPASGAGSSYNCVKRVKIDNTTTIQEHDGSGVAERTNSLGVYSLGQWVAQTNHATTGATDRTSGTVLMSVDSIAPTTGSGETLAPNAANWSSTLKRNVYNIVSYRKAIDPTSDIHAMFVGTGSLVCQQTLAITKMGFALMPGADGGDATSNANACGSINSSYRRTAGAAGSGGVDMSTPAAVTNAGATSQAKGVPFNVIVSGGIATHDAGGKVIVLDGEYGSDGVHTLGSTTIGAGQNVAATVAVTPIATGGAQKLYAYFVPKLGAIKVTTMSPVAAGTDNSFTSIDVATPSTTTQVSLRKAALGGTSRVVVWIKSADGTLPGGSVKLYKNSVSVANQIGTTDTLEVGEAASVFTYPQTAASMNLIATYTPADSSVTGSDLSFTSNVALANATIPAVNGVVIATGNNAFLAPTAAQLTATPQLFATTTKTAKKATAAAVTVVAATDVFTKTTHGLTVGDVLTFTKATTAGAALPGGLVAGTQYFVKEVPTTNTFKVSATLGGAVLDITSTGTGSTTYQLNYSPRATLTLTGAGSGASAVRPTGSVRVYISTVASDTSDAKEVSAASLGLTLANATAVTDSVATVRLPQVANWPAGVTGTVPAAGNLVYLTIKYSGDANFNALTVTKKVRVLP